MEFKTVLGTYQGVHITTDTESIPARAYNSKHAGWINRYGFWNIKLNDDWSFWVITEYLPWE